MSKRRRQKRVADAAESPEEVLRSSQIDLAIQAALTAGVKLLPRFTAELIDWHNRPGSEISAGYRVKYLDKKSAPVTDFLYVTTAEVGPPAVGVKSGDLHFDVWRHPNDPRLPSLSLATNPETVSEWLDNCSGDLGSLVDLTLVGYRPLRRAVLRAQTERSAVFIKLLRADKLPELMYRHELVAAAGLSADHLGSPAPGVLLLPQAPGKSLLDLFLAKAQLPEPAALVDVLDRLPKAGLELKRKPAWSERLDFHSATAATRIGFEKAEELKSRIEETLQKAPVGPKVVTHGDFYERNILVDGDQISIIDLDSMGPGFREDDLACALGHLAVLPAISKEHYGHLEPIVDQWTEYFSNQVDRGALAARVAAVILSLIASAADSEVAARLELVEKWLLEAEQSTVELN